MARELGLGVMPWSPLAFGFLAGKYTRGDDGTPQAGGGRLDLANTPFKKFTERNWVILDALRGVAAEINQPPVRVALAWALGRPGVSSLIIGASRLDQLRENLGALDLTLTTEQVARLDAASAPEPGSPAAMFNPDIRRSIFGGHNVVDWHHQ